jgi:hypothetical protein
MPGGVNPGDDAALICSISASLQVISELEASVRFLKPIRASSATTVLITRSPSRNAWWKEMVIPSCRPLRTASSREAHSLRLCFAPVRQPRRGAVGGIKRF